MITLNECLEHFVIASWANNDSGLKLCRDSMRSYLNNTGADPASQARALEKLGDACSELRFDSAIANIVKKDIAEKLREIGHQGADSSAAPSMTMQT